MTVRNQIPYWRNATWPDGVPKAFMEYILVQVRPIDGDPEWPVDQFGSAMWSTMIPSDRFEIGLHWDQALPFAGLIENLEEWFSNNPGRWKMRVFRAVRHDRCHHGKI